MNLTGVSLERWDALLVGTGVDGPLTVSEVVSMKFYISLMSYEMC